MFPFQFGKKLEYKCIWAENDDNGTWCSTDVDENGVHKPRSGNWGYCGPECPHADKPKAGMKFVVCLKCSYLMGNSSDIIMLIFCIIYMKLN